MIRGNTSCPSPRSNATISPVPSFDLSALKFTQQILPVLTAGSIEPLFTATGLIPATQPARLITRPIKRIWNRILPDK